MSGDTRSLRTPKVFISYAHQDAAFDASVGDVAEFLRGEGFEVVSDHLHEVTVPPEGWTAWMQHEIESSDFILVVCTPTMKDVFDRRKGLPVRGVIVESAFLISHIRKRITSNHSCFPILPDQGDRSHVPVLLEEFFNDHRFPLGQERIARLLWKTDRLVHPEAVFPIHAIPAVRSASMQTHHEEMTAERLAEAPLLLAALEAELALPTLADDDRRISRLMAHFCQHPGDAEKVIRLFLVIRRALGEAVLRCDSSKPSEHESIIAATVPLYLRCAFHLVDSAVGSRVVRVPTDELLICAIIGAALSGGQLEIDLDSGGRLPKPKGSPAIRVPERGDQWWFAFENEVYRVVMDDDPDAPSIAERGVPLNDAQRAALHARLRTITQVDRAAYTLVLHGFTDDSRMDAFAQEHSVRITVPSPAEDAASAAILGMSVHDLLAELVEFFKEVRGRERHRGSAGTASSSAGSRGPAPASTPASAAPPPTPAGPNHFFNLHLHAGRDAAMAMSGGTSQVGQGNQAGSGIQSGTGSQQGSGHVFRQSPSPGLDLAPILAVIQAFQQARGDIDDARVRARLEVKVDELDEVLRSSSAPDPSRLKAMIEGIKATAEAIIAGRAIVSACQAALTFLSSVIV